MTKLMLAESVTELMRVLHRYISQDKKEDALEMCGKLIRMHELYVLTTRHMLALGEVAKEAVDTLCQCEADQPQSQE